MPEVRFRVRWPDQSQTLCYSPSRVIKEFLVAGQSYALADFVDRSRSALQRGSQRVSEKYGFGCGHAQYQIGEIETLAKRFADDPAAHVMVEGFEE